MQNLQSCIDLNLVSSLYILMGTLKNRRL